MGKKRTSLRIINLAVDMIHVVICIAIIALTVILFMNPSGNQGCYPLIFFLAAVMNFTGAYARMNRNKPARGRMKRGFWMLFFGVSFMILTIISAITVLR